MAVTLLLPTGRDSDRESAVERFLLGAGEAASGLALRTIAVSPAFDRTDLADPTQAQAQAQAQGIFTRDRELRDSGRRFLGLDA